MAVVKGFRRKAALITRLVTSNQQIATCPARSPANLRGRARLSSYAVGCRQSGQVGTRQGSAACRLSTCGAAKPRHSRGSIGRKGNPPCRRSQFCRKAAMWRMRHSRTSPRARGGKRPVTRPVWMPIDADHSPASAVNCGSVLSSRYIAIAMPKNRLSSGIAGAWGLTRPRRTSHIWSSVVMKAVSCTTPSKSKNESGRARSRNVAIGRKSIDWSDGRRKLRTRSQ
jgi:hypothetical protein